jgi:Raf kinase inhibitor-like YbhB/YbcL family protein
MLRRRLVALAVAACVAAGCSKGERADAPDAAAEEITVSSSAFAAGEEIPIEYTCDGDGISPPLAWSGVPDHTAALALVVDDPDAPNGTYVHWVVVDIDADQHALDAGKPPAGAVEVNNSSGGAGYSGPCPPSGTHHYRFTVYALSNPVEVSPDDDLDAVFDEIAAAAIAQGRLTATFTRN